MMAADGTVYKTLEMLVYVAASRAKLYNFRETALLGQRSAVSRFEKCQFSKRGLGEGKNTKRLNYLRINTGILLVTRFFLILHFSICLL